MPQVFGTLSQSQQFVTACPLYDSRRVREERQRFRRDLFPEVLKANSLYCPSGRWPARGWLLLRREDYVKLAPYGKFALQIDDFKNGPLLFQNLYLVQARCVTRGTAANPDSIYLVEVTDARGVLWNRWFAFPTTSQYNVRSPAYAEQFYTRSMRILGGGGILVPWNWPTMVGDLWQQMAAWLGLFPGLPVTPPDIPEGWIFPGEPAWLALDRMLDHLGCVVAVDLTQASPYTIVQIGAADNNFTALTNQSIPEDDFEYIDTGQARVPGQVVVYFHKRYQFYGTEETVRRDNLQWSSTPLYSVTVNAPAQFTGATGLASVWDEYTVRVDVDNNVIPADAAMANVIAVDRAQQYYTKIYRGTLGYLRRVYPGTLPFAAGSQVDGVCWSEDYSLGRGGWRTEVIRGPQPPWPEVKVDEQ